MTGASGSGRRRSPAASGQPVVRFHRLQLLRRRAWLIAQRGAPRASSPSRTSGASPASGDATVNRTASNHGRRPRPNPLEGPLKTHLRVEHSPRLLPPRHRTHRAKSAAGATVESGAIQLRWRYPSSASIACALSKMLASVLEKGPDDREARSRLLHEEEVARFRYDVRLDPVSVEHLDVRIEVHPGAIGLADEDEHRRLQ